MDELSETKMESAKDFIANVDISLFKKNGYIK